MDIFQRPVIAIGFGSVASCSAGDGWAELFGSGSSPRRENNRRSPARLPMGNYRPGHFKGI